MLLLQFHAALPPSLLLHSLLLTFNLGVQVVDYDLQLPQCHVPQVGGFQASLHETLADVRHVRQLLTDRQMDREKNTQRLLKHHFLQCFAQRETSKTALHCVSTLRF